MMTTIELEEGPTIESLTYKVSQLEKIIFHLDRELSQARTAYKVGFKEYLEELKSRGASSKDIAGAAFGLESKLENEFYGI